jgi:protein-tyrosine phosphatase
MNILFVCTGNISRSFLAEMLLKNEIKRHQLKDISVSSAGTFAYPGTPGDQEMINYLSKTGIPVKNFESRPLTAEEVAWADLILVMERDHFKIIEDQWPDFKDKVELLAGYISPDQLDDDIIDPFGKSSYHYRAAQSQITLAVRSLIKKLSANNQKNQNA